MTYMSRFKTKSQGIVPIGSNLFGTCSTASGTSAKVVTMPDFNVLIEGVTIHVYFTNANTASNPTLQVGSTASTSISGGGTWKAGRVVSFTYHGGIWRQNDYQDGATYGLSYENGTLQLVEDSGSASVTIPDTDTWKPNTKTQEGYVTAGGTNNRKMWMTDENGNPSWDTNLVVISKADYNALTTAEKNNGDVYFVYDDDGGDSGLKYTKDVPDTSTSSGDKTNRVVQNDVSGNTVFNSYGLAEGKGTYASGFAAHAEGLNTVAGGDAAHAEGNGTHTSGSYAHSEGDNTVASNFGAHAEGSETVASGAYSHAEGLGSSTTGATGQASHAEGYDTTASGESSHAEGSVTIASGGKSHAEGGNTIASGLYSHAGGFRTEASRKSQTVIGEYNVVDTQGDDSTSKGKYAFIIGNGEYQALSNAYDVSWDGNVRMALATTEDLYQAISDLEWTSDVIV